MQKIVDSLTPPPGVKVFVTGGPALQADQQHVGEKSLRVIEFATIGVIIFMLLFFYRSILTVVLVLMMLILGLSVTRGVVAFLGYHELIGLSPFATQLLVTLAIAASTDYAIFLIGRYQEARTAGEDKESAYYTMFQRHRARGAGLRNDDRRGHFCLVFTRLPYFQTLGVPMAVGMVTAVLVALTLGPAMITVASRFGMLEPKRAMRIRFWRRLAAGVVRWPGWVLFLTVLIALVGLIMLPGYQPSYNDRKYLPADLPANQGFAAPPNGTSRRPAQPGNPDGGDQSGLAELGGLPGDRADRQGGGSSPRYRRVQSITRPDGKPLKYSTIPAQFGMGSTMQKMNRLTCRTGWPT